MIAPELKSILEAGASKTFAINPMHKDQIQRAAFEAAIREAKSALLQKRPVHIIVVRG